MLARYGNLGPGSRIRMFQYLPYLRDQGLQITVAPLLDDDYVRRLYAGLPTNKLKVAKAYAGRLWSLLSRERHFDLVWLQWELFPWLPGPLERLLLRSQTPVVTDYDDAIFHRYDLHRSGLVRAALGKKIDTVMKASDTVVVGNDYLGSRARAAGSKRVVNIPSVIDLKRYAVAEKQPSGRFTVGWMGTPSTAIYLKPIAPALATFCQQADGHVVVIGASKLGLSDLNVEYRDWSEDTEAAEIGSFDVGIMPLPEDPWSNGKCGYKLIQYMACGIPVIASPVGINRDIVEHGVNGFLAESASEWISALKALSDSEELRASMGRKARQRVEETYCLQVTAPHLLKVLQDTMRPSFPAPVAG